MVGAALVVSRRLEVLEEVGLERVGAGEVGRHDGEEPPAALARLGLLRLVVGGLLHQVAVHLVAQGLVLVAVLQKGRNP